MIDTYFRKRRNSLLTIGFLLFFSCIGVNNNGEIGHPYPGWKEGELDIHHLYTGRGESNFFIFPDSTSMLVDAGDYAHPDYLLMTPPLPDTTRRSGEWIARYIGRVNPRKNHVDYFFLSHFHSDHFGEGKMTSRMTEGRTPNYILSGISETAEYIDFDKLIDRDYPHYNFPNIKYFDSGLANYRNFVDWKVKTGKLQAERFEVGRNDQIVLRYQASRYPNFRIQNLVSNAAVWTGNGLNADSLICSGRKNRSSRYNENMLSCGIRLTFGDFRYYTAGDLSGSINNEAGEELRIENLTAKVCGEVDVCKVNHHGYLDAMPEDFIRGLKAGHYIFPVWDYQHVQASVINRVSSPEFHAGKSTHLYFTYISEEIRSKCALHGWNNQVSKENGHVIVKVLNNGAEYKIYIVSAEDESMRVKAVYGPFFSKKNKLS